MKVISKLTVACSTLFLAVSLHAGELDTVLKSTAGQQANFVQKFTPKGFKKEQVESGSVIFGAPPRMRWTYRSPEAKVFVFDGDTSWLYTAADRQVMVTRLTADQRRSVPLAFLWDAAAKKTFTSREKVSGSVIDVKLNAASPDAAVRQINVQVGRSDHRIRRIDYTDRQGNRTVFELSAYTPAAVTAATFKFSAPAGVQVIEN